MREINLNKEAFIEFNQDDQFGFFYDEDGFPKKDASDTFEADVDDLYSNFEYISVDAEDNIFGVKNGKKELLMRDVIQAFEIAEVVT